MRTQELAYLYTIARNMCVDEYRKQKTLNIDDYQDLQAGESVGQENVINQVAIENAFASIPEDLREIVTLRYISEVSAADIAKIVGMSRFAVNRRIKHGLSQLREFFETS